MAGLWRRRRDREDAPADAADAASVRLADVFAEPAPADDERAEQYSQWATRMREKRTRVQQTMRRGHAEPEGAGSYWDPDLVFQETERLEAEAATSVPNRVDVSAALAVLGLEEGVELLVVERRYRQLAKDHHPDRHTEADEATRTFHAKRFRAVNDARQVLRQALA